MSIPTVRQGGAGFNPARTTAKGRLNQVYIVSRNRGAATLTGSSSANHQLVPAPIIQSFSITPKLASETVPQFGQLNPVLTDMDYSECEISFDVMETDLFTIYAAICNIGPNTTAFTVMPERLYRETFTVFGNQFDENSGSIFESFVVTGISLTAASRSQDPGKGAKLQFKGTGTIYRWNNGFGIDYYRFTNSAPAYTTPYDVVLTAGTTGVMNNPAATIPPYPNMPVWESGNYTNYNLALYNSDPVTAGFSIASSTVTVTTSGAPSDVWEYFIPVSGVLIGNVN